MKEEGKRFLDIDLDNLHIEAAKQANLCKRFSDKLADLKMEHDEAEAYLDVIKAEVAMDVRKNPASFGFTKAPSVDAIKEAVTLSTDCQEANDRVIKAKHAVGICAASVNAIEHKKRMIEKAIDLALASYFASPNEGERTSEAAIDFKKKRDMEEMRSVKTKHQKRAGK